jgi:hypothetical protein
VATIHKGFYLIAVHELTTSEPGPLRTKFVRQLLEVLRKRSINW